MQGQLINHYLSRAIAKNSCIVHRCAWLLRICVSISRYYAALFCAFLLKKKKERKNYTYERGESKEISFSIWRMEWKKFFRELNLFMDYKRMSRCFCFVLYNGVSFTYFFFVEKYIGYTVSFRDIRWKIYNFGRERFVQILRWLKGVRFLVN